MRKRINRKQYFFSYSSIWYCLGTVISVLSLIYVCTRRHAFHEINLVLTGETNVKNLIWTWNNILNRHVRLEIFCYSLYFMRWWIKCICRPDTWIVGISVSPESWVNCKWRIGNIVFIRSKKPSDCVVLWFCKLSKLRFTVQLSEKLWKYFVFIQKSHLLINDDFVVASSIGANLMSKGK